MFFESTTKSVQNRQLKYAKIIILFGAVVYPIWGYLSYLYTPSVEDYTWFRFVMAVGVSLGYLWVGKSPFNAYRRSQQVILVGSLLTSAHSALVFFEPQAGMVQFVGLFILIGAIYCSLSDYKHMLIFSLWVCMTFVLGLTIGSNSYPAPLILVALISSVTAGWFVNHNRIMAFQFLEESARQSSMVLQTLREGIVLQDEEGRVFAMNQAVPRILGLSREAILGQKSSDLKWNAIKLDGTPVKKEEYPSMVALRTQQPCTNFVMGIYTPDRELRWISVNSVPFLRKDGQCIVTSFTDISEIKTQEDLIKHQETQLLYSAKMTSLGEIAGNVAHEINNPLAIISGRVAQMRRLILKDGFSKDMFMDILGNIDSTIVRIDKIVQGMRYLSRDGEQDPLKRVPFAKILEETLGMYRERFVQNGVIVQVSLERPVEILCREVQISQILLHLLSNSFDSVKEHDARWIKINASVSHQTLIIRVEDSGPPIPKDVKEKMMKPFFSTKDGGKGTGLGLSISLNIARNHNGNLYFDSEAAHTCFVLELPIAQRQVLAV